MPSLYRRMLPIVSRMASHDTPPSEPPDGRGAPGHMATTPIERCTHRPPCPGCPRYGEPGLPDSVAEALARLTARFGVEPTPLETGAPLGFRHRARLMVRGRANSPKVGLFQAGSHRIVDTPRCGVHHPLVNRVTAALRQAVRGQGVDPYADAPHRGSLRAVQVAVERESGTAQIVLVENASKPGDVERLVAPLSEALGADLHSLWWNGQPERTNAILGPHWRRFSGPPAIREPAGAHHVYHPPGAFGQSHPLLFDRLAARLRAHVPEGCIVSELYAGVGTLGLPLLPNVRELRLNEVNPHGIAGLTMGAAAMPGDLQARLRFGTGPAAEHLSLLEGADVVIVDPPRRGLEPEVLSAIAARPPRLLLYVSCRPARLADEAEILAASGLVPTVLEPFDLFPYGEHAELLAVFERS